MVITIDVKYKIGEIVYLVTDPDQNARIVKGYIILSGSYTKYLLSYMDYDNYEATEIEITKQKTIFV